MGGTHRRCSGLTPGRTWDRPGSWRHSFARVQSKTPLPIVLGCGPSRFFSLASRSHPAVCVRLCETSWGGGRFQGAAWNVLNSGPCSHQSKRQTFCGSNCIYFSCTRGRNEGRCPWQPQGPDSHAAVWTSPALWSWTRRWAQPPTPRSRYELRRRAGGQMARTGTAAQCPCERQSPARPLTCSPPGATLDLQEVGGLGTIRDKWLEYLCKVPYLGPPTLTGKADGREGEAGGQAQRQGKSW